MAYTDQMGCPPFPVKAGAHRSSLQVQMPFLCQECEEMLNTSGEKYALSISFIEPEDFPLQDMLAAELAARLVTPNSGQREVVSHHA